MKDILPIQLIFLKLVVACHLSNKCGFRLPPDEIKKLQEIIRTGDYFHDEIPFLNSLHNNIDYFKKHQSIVLK